MTISSLQELVDSSRQIVFFGGAGISTESAIPDFRSVDGLFSTTYGNYRPEDIISRSFFDAHPDAFYDFYRNRMIYPDARPNAAHLALAALEQRGRLTAVITQNIDGLHQIAGSQHVLELHGSVHRNSCMRCQASYDLNTIVQAEAVVPLCPACGGTIKPDVVLYEESLDQHVLEQAVHAISSADMLIVGGTSLRVYPAAGLIQYYTGQKLVLINKTETTYDTRANLIIRESIGAALGSLQMPS